jgi:hypothetical protein
MAQVVFGFWDELWYGKQVFFRVFAAKKMQWLRRFHRVRASS